MDIVLEQRDVNARYVREHPVDLRTVGLLLLAPGVEELATSLLRQDAIDDDPPHADAETG